MSQPFARTEDGHVLISEAEVLKSQMVVSAVGVSLPPDFAEKAQEKADLLERRLQRIEAALGFSEIPEHNAAIRAAIASL